MKLLLLYEQQQRPVLTHPPTHLPKKTPPSLQQHGVGMRGFPKGCTHILFLHCLSHLTPRLAPHSHPLFTRTRTYCIHIELCSAGPILQWLNSALPAADLGRCVPFSVFFSSLSSHSSFSCFALLSLLVHHWIELSTRSRSLFSDLTLRLNAHSSLQCLVEIRDENLVSEFSFSSALDI
ncbi:hypothetical protein BJ165DRAFT_1440775 [Panaeolus papilionaceus]|nr:hypothetical protein BJ165DRAFT_1440775 [Panaeolus papilionaceus]